jgi:hypothetical protein
LALFDFDHSIPLFLFCGIAPYREIGSAKEAAAQIFHPFSAFLPVNGGIHRSQNNPLGPFNWTMEGAVAYKDEESGWRRFLWRINKTFK